MRTLGVSAALTPGLTVHTQTFVNAVNDAYDCLPTEIRREVSLEWACDEMSAAGGRKAAQQLLSKSANLVVGHFSSQAAEAAIPYYLSEHVPVILPCSSQDDLTAIDREKFNNPMVFRLSCSNGGLMQAVGRLLEREKINPADLGIWSADSIYARQLSFAARVHLASANSETETPFKKSYLLLGHHHDVVGKIVDIRRQGHQGLIIILDDAIDPELAEVIGQEHCRGVLGIIAEAAGGQSDKKLSAAPFYKETHLAVQIACCALATGKQREALAEILLKEFWDEDAGQANFNEDGENLAFQFGVWGVRNGVFQRSFVI